MEAEIAIEHELKDLASGKCEEFEPTPAPAEVVATAEPVTVPVCLESSGRYWLIMHSLLVATGSVIGFAFFVLFGFIFENYHGAVTAFLSGILALALFHIQTLEIREKLHEWYNGKVFSNIQLFAVITNIASLIAVLVYLVFAIVKHQEFEPITECLYPAVIFSFLVFIWSSFLFWIVRKHIQQSRLDS